MCFFPEGSLHNLLQSQNIRALMLFNNHDLEPQRIIEVRILQAQVHLDSFG